MTTPLYLAIISALGFAVAALNVAIIRLRKQFPPDLRLPASVLGLSRGQQAQWGALVRRRATALAESIARPDIEPKEKAAAQNHVDLLIAAADMCDYTAQVWRPWLFPASKERKP